MVALAILIAALFMIPLTLWLTKTAGRRGGGTPCEHARTATEFERLRQSAEGAKWLAE
jgi:hypothetical protein